MRVDNINLLVKTLKPVLRNHAIVLICAARIAAQLVISIATFAVFISAQNIITKQTFAAGDFKLVYKNKAADVIVSAEDFRVAHIAASDLAADVERVTGRKPRILDSTQLSSRDAVIIGTLGKSSLINALEANGKLNTAKIRNKWETFFIASVDNPLPNIRSALVIAGSDRRGTAYGVYELSQRIGVSPWYWWADVTPEHKDNLIVSRGLQYSREPSVKYRGIFLNDEDWGLQPWAAKTFEPETGDIGPKTYAKIFELLLRLKANTLWPAMHEVTRPFNSITENRQTADDYAIVMGSSHAEPMLRNNVGEWKGDKNDYNLVTNAKGVTKYWEERVKENGRFENVYTIGMRGIHDSPIPGTKSQAERISLLEKIFEIQRGLIAKNVNRNVEQVPQIFCPYKEVLTDYRAGLKVPDDVTIVFPDDNFGYIRRFPNADEQKRKGGFGIYYHISYLGRPLSYLWLNSTPPALIWEEISKAYENGIREFWMLNVGDIKPAEIGIEFFMQIAYDAKKWNVANQNQFLRSWAGREFGAEFSVKIADIMATYYGLGFQRKPEHLQWYLPGETPRKSDLTETETLERLDAYRNLRDRAEALYTKIPAAKKDAFYELVLYPIRSAASANERFFAAELANFYKERNGVDSRQWASRSIAADTAIASETAHFSEKLAGGKWRFIMSPEMNAGQWPSMRSSSPKISLNDFGGGDYKVENYQPTATVRARPFAGKVSTLFIEREGVVSIEAENFRKSAPQAGFSWQIIDGLGKTGDSVSVFPARATTFGAASPALEYQIDIAKAADFQASFYLIPTQPLVSGSGLRLAFSIDGGEGKTIVVDKETEVSSRKWAANILDETTIGTAKISLTAGRHALRVFAVDTGVVLDKILLSSHELPTSYFGPRETRAFGR